MDKTASLEFVVDPSLSMSMLVKTPSPAPLPLLTQPLPLAVVHRTRVLAANVMLPLAWVLKRSAKAEVAALAVGTETRRGRVATVATTTSGTVQYRKPGHTRP